MLDIPEKKVVGCADHASEQVGFVFECSELVSSKINKKSQRPIIRKNHTEISALFDHKMQQIIATNYGRLDFEKQRKMQNQHVCEALTV